MSFIVHSTPFTLCNISLHATLCSRYNESGNGKINIQELKTMMEKLKAPQTHLGLSASSRVKLKK